MIDVQDMDKPMPRDDARTAAALPAAAPRAMVVLGATSSVARAAAIELAVQGYDLVLAARDLEETELIATDVRIRSQRNVHALAFDALDFDGHAAFVSRCTDLLGDALYGVVLCFGHMEDQAEAQRSFAAARRTIDINYTGAVSILERFAGVFEERGEGVIAALSSVAGDRGRQSNYLYGSAKAGLTAYLQGLRNRLYHSGVHVVTIKPGFMDTRMTFGLSGLFLVATPAAAGRAIAKAIQRRRNVAYVPWFWLYIMLIIRHVPEVVFKRLRM